MAYDFPNAPSIGAIYAPAGGPAWQWDGTAWQITSVTVQGIPPLGQCYLDYSGGNLVLSRYQGRHLFINGTNQVIPDVGVTLAPPTMTAGTAYYIYAFMSSGVMTLQASANPPAIDATYGNMIRTAFPTHVLVGMALCEVANTFDSGRCSVASWFNPRRRSVFGTVNTGATTSVSFVELHSGLRTPFASFISRDVEIGIHCRMFSQNTASQDCWSDPRLNGVSVIPTAMAFIGGRVGSGAGTTSYPLSARFVTTPANAVVIDGRNVVQWWSQVSGGQGTWNLAVMSVSTEG